MMRTHSLITAKDYDAGYKACQGDFFKNQNVPACSAFLNNANNAFGNINPYYLYDSCPWLGISSTKYQLSFQSKPLQTNYHEKIHPLFQMFRHGGWSRRVGLVGGKARAENDSPCVSLQSIAKYFNRDDVRRALGVTHGTVDPSGWGICTNAISYTQIYMSVLPFYTKLLPYISIQVYSGDVDMVVNSLGTEQALDKLNLAETSSWKTWEHDSENGVVVGGYYRQFATSGKGLFHCTIRGAGHMTVSYLRLYNCFNMWNSLGSNHKLLMKCLSVTWLAVAVNKDASVFSLLFFQTFMLRVPNKLLFIILSANINCFS